MEKIPSVPPYPSFYEIFFAQQEKVVIGVDEAGRGCLAGPVVAACVVLPLNLALPDKLKDSKLLSDRDLEIVYSWIINHAHYAWASADAYEIDRYGIVPATKKAMLRALEHVALQIDKNQLGAVVIDAVKLSHSLACDTFSFFYGEKYSPSIAAASIIAKVSRDRLLRLYAHAYPSYGFDAHHGYGTKKHYSMLEEKKACIAHRTYFLKKFYAQKAQ